MPRKVHIDLETRSPTDLRKSGVYRYVEDPNTDVWVARYAIDDGPIKAWYPDMPAPEFEPDDEFYAWNAQFERVVWRAILGPRYGWPSIKLSRWHDVMVWALSMGLPAGLDLCARALKMPVAKDQDGYKLMMKMARPRRPRKGQDPDGLYWWDDPDNVKRLSVYCERDVELERNIAHMIPRPSKREHEYWLLDQYINDTGIGVDLPLVDACVSICETQANKLNDRMTEITDGAVQRTTQIQRLKDWLFDTYFLAVGSMDKDHAPLLLESDIPDEAKAAIKLRVEGSKSSTAKMKTIQDAHVRGRLFGLFRYNYASTGRWSSSLVQLHNLPRGAGKRTDELCELLLHEDADTIDLLWGPPNTAVSDAIRGCLIPAPKCSLTIADFSQIEARINAYLAGQLDIIKTFRDADLGMGPDVYVVQAGKVGSDNRQLGKVMVLALGYGMGHDKFRDTAASYGIDFKYETRECINEEGEVEIEVLVDEARDLKDAWRAANPAIEQFWWDLEAAAIAAVSYPGKTFEVGEHIKYRTSGNHLWCLLPSGRPICYPFPVVRDAETPWGAMKPQLTYMTMHEGRWIRSKSYGGHQCENIVQGTAADVLKHVMRRIHDEVPHAWLVAHVHDEPITEGPIKRQRERLDQILDIMGDGIPWLPGCPIKGAGFNAMRYQKD